MRLSAYIKKVSQGSIRPLEETLFWGFEGGDLEAIYVFDNLNMQKTLLEENIGYVNFIGGKDLTTKHEYITFPLFETKQKIPDTITWYDFFMKLDKTSYLFPDWYKQFENADPQWNLNDVLFPSAEASDGVYNFFYRLKAISGLNTEAQQKTFVTSYQSTYWWNIRGTKVTKETIMKHIGEGSNAKNIPGTNLNFAPSNWGGDPFGYLTKASKASFIRKFFLFY